MSRTLRRLLAGIVLLMAVVAAVVLFWLDRVGAFVHVEPHFAGTCQPLPLPGSAEDIRIDRSGAVAYLSVLDRGAVAEGQDATGTILRVDLRSEPIAAAPAIESAPEGFRPRGLSLFTAPEGSQTLFVLSDPRHAPHTVEVFRREGDGAFVHSETLHNPLLFSPHSIAAVSPSQFYVTNDTGARSAFERFTELTFGRAISTVVYYDGHSMRVVDDAIAQASGIAASADGGRIYVGQAGARSVRVYSRDSSTGDLAWVEDVKVYSSPDNLDIAEDGGIWVAAHPNLLALEKHLHNPDLRVATQI
ncbi:MAG TPA: hypothetical protein VH542_06455, partial [Steroidobacteraceae bacterium]